MLLVFRQHRLASSATGGASVMLHTRSSSGAFAGECAEQLVESRERCTAARRCGCRAGTARLLFFCRRFLFQIKRKCRNAGSIYCLIMVCSEGRNQLATIQPYYNFVSASPISDSRKGCPYEQLAIDICRFRGSSASRSPHPTSCVSKNSGRFRGRIISALPHDLEQSEISPQSRLRRVSSPTGEPNRFCNKSKSIKPINLARLYTLQQQKTTYEP